MKDILYIESIGRIAKIHCNEGTLETYEQIGILADKLSDKSFFRCHKCFLVNLDYVDSFDKTEVRLENGERIMLAKRRYEDFQKRRIWILSHPFVNIIYRLSGSSIMPVKKLLKRIYHPLTAPFVIL